MRLFWLTGGIRHYVRRPAVLVIGLCIIGPALGINAALFSVADTFIVSGLPYPDVENLFILRQHDSTTGKIYQTVSRAEAEAIRQSPQVEGLTIFGGTTATRRVHRDVGGDLEVAVAEVDRQFAKTLRLPIMGESILANEILPGSGLLSARLWRELGGSSSSGAHRSIRLDNLSFTIVGVLAENFVFPDFELPIQPGVLLIEDSSGPPLGRVFAVVRSTRRLELLQQAIDGIVLGVQAQNPSLKGAGVKVVPLTGGLLEAFQPTFRSMVAASLLVLLAAAVTTGILTAEDALRRAKEFRVRTALGESLATQTLQVIWEVSVLAASAAAVAVVAAHVWLNAWIGHLPHRTYRLLAHGVDSRTIAAVTFFALAIALVASVGPLLEVRRLRTQPAARSRYRLLGAFVAIEMCVATGVSATMWQMWGTIRDFRSGHLGHEVRNAMTIDVPLPSRATAPAVRYAALQESLARIRLVPEVVAVGGSMALPLTGRSPELRFPVNSIVPGAQVWRAGTGYFAAAGIPLLSGREFTDKDGTDNTVAIASNAFAEHVWGNSSAIGRTVSVRDNEAFRVIGVVADVRQSFAGAAVPALYLPIQPNLFAGMPIVVRTSGSLQETERAIAGILHNRPEMGLLNARPLTDRIERALSLETFQLHLAQWWAGVAFMLTLFGVSIVSVRVVHARWRESAIRVALGASMTAVVGTIMRRVIVAILCGAGCGALFYRTAGNVTSHLMNGIQPLATPSFVLVICLVTMAAIAVALSSALRLRRLEVSGVLRGPSDLPRVL